jgi:hypothetical protein
VKKELPKELVDGAVAGMLADANAQGDVVTAVTASGAENESTAQATS